LVTDFIRRARDARRTRRWAKERQDAEKLRMSVGAVELMVELRKMADYDPGVPPALAAHMRKDLWNSTQWLFKAIAMTDQPQKLRILGHRLRIGAGWTTDEAAIDSTEADAVRVLHAARQVWIAADGLHTVDGQHWWGRLHGGRFAPNGTYGSTGADLKLSQISGESLAVSVPGLLAQLGEQPVAEA
jgi:hypothetical protein